MAVQLGVLRTAPRIWSFSWTPSASGSVTIKSRAIDDTGNFETPGAGVTVTVGTGGGGTGCTTNCTIWPSTTVPTRIDEGADSPVQLGVKFRSDVAGTITGIRFYKASTNTGTHVGSLWPAAGGQPLASATFINETASGWQQVNFTPPVAITANTVYVASYHTTVGHYSQDCKLLCYDWCRQCAAPCLAKWCLRHEWRICLRCSERVPKPDVQFLELLGRCRI